MRWRLPATVLACLATPLAAQDAPPSPLAPEVVVRQSLDPAAGAVIGQHVALRIDVLFRGGMLRPPRVGLPDVAGLQALRFETQGTTMRETIAGEAYVGQRFEFALYARRGGGFDIPPATVTLLDAKGDAIGPARGEGVRLDVEVPPGVDPSQPVVATRHLALGEQWEPDPKGPFKAGDAIVRTITRTAQDVPGLAMRDLSFPAPEGVQVYGEPPQITDQSNRGVVTGRRVDRVTYLFERGGRFTLPAVSQPWWDLAAGALNAADAAGATIDVAAAPTRADVGPLVRMLVPVVAGGLLLAVLALAALRLLRGRRGGDVPPERAAFAAVRRACSGADAGAIHRAFSLWLPFLEPAGRRAAIQAATPLDAALFSGGSRAWTAADSQHLLVRLASLRRSCATDVPRTALPPLNP